LLSRRQFFSCPFVWRAKLGRWSYLFYGLLYGSSPLASRKFFLRPNDWINSSLHKEAFRGLRIASNNNPVLLYIHYRSMLLHMHFQGLVKPSLIIQERNDRQNFHNGLFHPALYMSSRISTFLYGFIFSLCHEFFNFKRVLYSVCLNAARDIDASRLDRCSC